MKTMKRSGVGALLALLLTTLPGNAQEADRSCRCVDEDGTEIQRCTCFRTPDIEGLVAQLVPFSGRPRLGISIDPGQDAESDADGALVTSVMEDGPADEAGIQAGDVITRVDGVSLTSSMGADAEASFDLDDSIPVQRLLAVTRELEPGESVEVEYLRDGQLQTTIVEVRDLSGPVWGGDGSAWPPSWDERRFREQMRSLTDGARAWQFRGQGDTPSEYRFPLDPGPDARLFGRPGPLYGDGLELAEVNPGLGEYFGTEEGVLVLDVDRRSALGLEPGDVVVRIGNRPVATPDRFRRILSSYGDDEDIDFHVLRDGSEVTVTGRFRY
jgi:hypothetical protein